MSQMPRCATRSCGLGQPLRPLWLSSPVLLNAATCTLGPCRVLAGAGQSVDMHTLNHGQCCLEKC